MIRYTLTLDAIDAAAESPYVVATLAGLTDKLTFLLLESKTQDAEKPEYVPLTPADPDVVDGIEVDPHITEYLAFGSSIYFDTSMFAEELYTPKSTSLAPLEKGTTVSAPSSPVIIQPGFPSSVTV